MSNTIVDPQVREALWDLQRYLSDEVAPMMVTDSIEVLLRCPPSVAAGEIHGWLANQTTGPASDAPISDCLFHAMKKIHLMAEFNLIEEEQLDRYLHMLGEIVIGFCPEQDRNLFRDNLERLGQAVDSATASRVEYLHRQVGGSADATDRPAATADPAAAAPTPTAARPVASATPVAAQAAVSQIDLDRGMKRLALVLERIGSTPQPAFSGQAMNVAARNARNGAEFEGYLTKLKEKGLEVDGAEVFRTLGADLPGWSLPEGAPMPPYGNVEAMHRLISHPADPAEGANRFSEMVQAAIEQFNEGNLVQAQTMFELASRIVAEKRLKPEVVGSIKLRCHENLDTLRLHESSQDPSSFSALRSVLEFFPALSVKSLMDNLQGEPRRERRKLQLALLEVHGEPARVEALDRLGFFAGDLSNDPNGWFQRNLVYLLRRIEHNDGAEEELALLIRSSELDQPVMVIREALGALAQWQHTRSERILIERLRQVEAVMTGEEETVFERDDQEQLLDRVIAALAGLGTPNALRAIVAHGFGRKTQMGDTMVRLEALGAQDLAIDKELVEHLVAALRKELPSKVLGFVVQKNTGPLIGLIRALGGTPGPSVRAVMEEIVERFPERDFGEAAAAVLDGFGALRKEDPQAGLTGDVELFGLPNLLQSLCDAQLTGTLTLIDREGRTHATLQLHDRKLVGCVTGPLTGEVAFYQLFERPMPGTFSFKKGQPEGVEGEPMEVMPAILEALRRHDEYRAACAAVPDDAALVAGGVKPTPPEDETDVPFMRSVWVKASSGTTPEKCELAIASDAYRIRRLYAHWVELGALRPA